MEAVFTLFGEFGDEDPGFFDYIEAYVVQSNCESWEMITRAIDDGLIVHPGKVLVHVLDDVEDAWVTTWEVRESPDGLEVFTWIPDGSTQTPDITHWPPRR